MGVACIQGLLIGGGGRLQQKQKSCDYCGQETINPVFNFDEDPKFSFEKATIPVCGESI